MTISTGQVEVILAAFGSGPLVGAVVRELPQKLPRTLDEWWGVFVNILKQWVSMKEGATPPPNPTKAAQ